MPVFQSVQHSAHAPAMGLRIWKPTPLLFEAICQQAAARGGVIQ